LWIELQPQNLHPPSSKHICKGFCGYLIIHYKAMWHHAAAWAVNMEKRDLSPRKVWKKNTTY
jgi:hypothetical protein